MAFRELIVLRHGKSSWDTDEPDDHDRPLAKRGLRDSARMGALLEAGDLVPDCVISSTAKRARQTACRAAEAMGIPADAVLLEERIYAAGMHDLLGVLGTVPSQCRRVLLVGHNPGLENLVGYLGGAEASAYRAPKFFPTCALAVFRIAEDWSDLLPRDARIIRLVRPKDLPD